MSTFENIDFWLETVKKATDDNIVIYLVGNKADLIDSSGNNRRVTKEQAIQYSKYRHFQGFGECSALKNINIKKMEMIQKVKENKFILKMVVLGDVGVGKSNIIRRIMNQNFQELEATVGVEFTYIDVEDVDPNDPSKVLSIQIWDTCK